MASILLLVPGATWRPSRLEASKGDVVSETAINGDLCNVWKSPPFVKAIRKWPIMQYFIAPVLVLIWSVMVVVVVMCCCCSSLQLAPMQLALVVLNRNSHMKPYSGATETQKHVASYDMPHCTITYAVHNACTLAIPASITGTVGVMHTVQCHIYNTHSFSLTRSMVCCVQCQTCWHASVATPCWFYYKVLKPDCLLPHSMICCVQCLICWHALMATPVCFTTNCQGINSNCPTVWYVV